MSDTAVTTRPYRGGRRTRLTPALVEQIAARVRVGVPEETAAAACGLSVMTFREWMRRGRGTDTDRPSKPIYERLVRELERAGGESESWYAMRVRDAARQDWRAAGWSLEHAPQTRESWGPVRKVDSTMTITQAESDVHITALESMARLYPDAARFYVEQVRAAKARLVIDAEPVRRLAAPDD
jgi:hypothetical protein